MFGFGGSQERRFKITCMFGKYEVVFKATKRLFQKKFLKKHNLQQDNLLNFGTILQGDRGAGGMMESMPHSLFQRISNLLRCKTNRLRILDC